MGQEIIYSVLTRPTLKPSDLVYRRRVSSTDASEQSLSATEEDEDKDYGLKNSDKHEFPVFSEKDSDVKVSKYRVDEKV